LYATEVGARGFCVSSFMSTFFKLDFSPKAIQHLKIQVCMTLLKASFWTLLARDDANWLPKKIDFIVNKVIEPKARNTKLDDFQLYFNNDDMQFKHIYNLAAFVIHSGSCMTGHYESAVRRGKQWYEAVVCPSYTEKGIK